MIIAEAQQWFALDMLNHPYQPVAHVAHHTTHRGQGGHNTVLDLAPPAVRAEALASLFLAAYLGLSVPIIGLGVATQFVSACVALLGFAGPDGAQCVIATPGPGSRATGRLLRCVWFDRGRVRSSTARSKA